MSEAARGNWLCGFGHDPEVAFARIEKTGEMFSTIQNGQAGMPVLP
jgi:hypothetical protein